MKKNKLVYPLIGLISISTIFFSACTSKLDSNVPVQLENHMTQEELSRVSQTDFMLLDKPWENYQVVDDNSEYGSMENRIVIARNMVRLLMVHHALMLFLQGIIQVVQGKCITITTMQLQVFLRI